MIAAGLWHNLTELFSGMGIVTLMLFAVGLMLIVIEFYQPSYGIPTYCGVTLLLAAIVIRMLAGGTFVMLFFMVFFCSVILVAAHLLMLCTQKRIWLTQSLTLKLENSMREDDDDDGYADLLGRDGIATTDIDGNGHVRIDDVNFFVTSDTFVPKDSVVRVVQVSGDRIEVEAVQEDTP